MRFTLLILFISVFFISCEYEPGGLYDAKVPEPNNPPDATFNLDNFEGQIELYMKHTFTFSTDILGSEIYEMEVYFDSTLIYTTEENSSEFMIDPEDYDEGEYILEIKVYSKTNSGSLADVFGAEAYVYGKKWDVLIDESIIPVSITSIYRESGSLKITWNKYDRSNFQRYDVIRMNRSGSSSKRIGYFDDQNTTSCFDPDFIGGKGTYYIRIHTTDDSKSSDYFTFIDSIPKIVSATTISNKLEFKWTKCKYPSNFEEYKLIRCYGTIYGTSVFDVNDTSLTIFTDFGEPICYSLKTNQQSGYYNVVEWFETFLGERSKEFTKAIPTKNPDYIFQMQSDYLYRYSIGEGQYVDSLYVSNASANLFTASSDGSYLIFGTVDQLYKINPLDFWDYEIYTTNDINGNSDDKFSMISISDNGIAAICGTESFKIYDFVNNVVAYEENTVKTDVLISPNNQYVLDTDYYTILYKFDGSQLDSLTLLGAYNIIKFDPLSGHKLIRYNEARDDIELFNCETLTAEKSIYAYRLRDLDVDPITGLVFAENGSKVYNIYTETSLSNGVRTTANCIFHNSVVYASTGYLLDLEIENNK